MLHSYIDLDLDNFSLVFDEMDLHIFHLILYTKHFIYLVLFELNYLKLHFLIVYCRHEMIHLCT